MLLQPAVYCLGPGESEGLTRAAAARLSQPVLELVAGTQPPLNSLLGLLAAVMYTTFLCLHVVTNLAGPVQRNGHDMGHSTHPRLPAG